MIYDLLFPYQRKIVDSAKDKDAVGLFMDTGTGKSYTSLALYEQKIVQSKCNKLIIICLNSKLYEWQKDCEKFFPFTKILVMDGTKKVQKDKDLRDLNFDILIINFEKAWRHEELLMINDKYFILVDESHVIKDSKTKIGKFMRLLGMKTPYKVILTATPMANGYIDLYNQFYFLGLLDISLSRFKQEYCIEKYIYIGMTQFKKIVGYRNTELLDLLTQKYCYFYERKLDDDMIPEEIKIPFKLDKNYYDIAKDRVYKDVILDNVSSKRIGLKSLCSGTLMGRAICDEEGDLSRLYQLNTDKLNWVKDFLQGFNERVVIYYNYTHQREQLYEMITKLGRHCGRYCADIKEQDIYDTYDDTVMLVQYKSGSTGIDWLKKGYVCIFYSLPDSYLCFYQSKGRLNRVGQTKKVLYYLLVSEGKYSVDELNYQALLDKKDFNDQYFQDNFGNCGFLVE